jgi:hypothetical protein
MLRVLRIKYSRSCKKHPGYSPANDGAGGIRGNCSVCAALLEIYTANERLQVLMRALPATVTRKPRTPKPERQLSFLDF